MPIPRKTVHIPLKPATPTPLTAEGLQAQLRNIGLNCPDTFLPNLRQHIEEVKTQIPNGSIQSYGIMTPAVSGASLAAVFLTDSATGNWEPDGEGLGYNTELGFIQNEQHFSWLMDKNNRPLFTGVESKPPQYTSRVPTIDAVKTMFVNVGVDASATLVKGIDKTTLEAVLANAIAPLNDQNATDYNQPGCKVIFLVDNYNSTTQAADGIGVLAIEWTLSITDYLVKKQAPQHDAALTIKSRSVLYADLDVMMADFEAARLHFNVNAFSGLLSIPIKRPKVTIFPSRPPAVKDTFDQSIPIKSTTTELEVIVLYSPDLQIIGSIDNTASATTTTYSQAVTQGFTFTASQSLSVAASLEANFEVVKAGVTVTAEISFTEEWSKSSTISMSFEVPAGKKAFNYQGYIIAEILSYDTSSNTFSYKGGSARCLTNVLTSRDTPIPPPSRSGA